jgi:hypothetical protein
MTWESGSGILAETLLRETNLIGFDQPTYLEASNLSGAEVR